MVEKYFEAKITWMAQSKNIDEIAWDQNVRIRTSDGLEFECMYIGHHLPSEILNQVKRIEIHTTNNWGHSKIQKVTDGIPKVKKVIPRTESGEATDRLLIIARVIKILKEENSLIVSPGFGNLRLDIERDLSIFDEITIGDLIKLETGRLDLVEVLD